MDRRRALEQGDLWLDKLGLAGFGGRFPRHLSGGQRKRVAIAQVLTMQPKLLLMDEPFASLDAIVRARIIQDVAELVERERISVLLVTHDLEEAISLSDRIYLLSQGPRARITQQYQVPIARPRDLVKARVHPAFGPLYQRTLERSLPRGRFPPGRGCRMTALDPRWKWMRQVAAFAVLLLLWEAAGRAGLLNPLFVPSPSLISRALFELFADGRIWPHIDATFTAALLGLALGILAGVLLGVVAALLPPVAELLEPG